MYDIVIVGAGPAGANLARLIGEKYRILLLDKRDLASEYPLNAMRKCCGGLLAPDAQKMIAKLGLGIPKDVLVNPQLFAVRTIDLKNQLEQYYQRFYYNMDRERFDRWLVSLIPSKVEQTYNAVVQSITQTAEGFTIRYIQDGKETIVQSRLIVGADGAFSTVRKLLCQDAVQPKQYIAIQEWFACDEEIPYFTAIFDEEITDFYSWIIPKEKHLLLGTAVEPGAQAWWKYQRLKEKLDQLGFAFDRSIRTEGSYLCRPQHATQFYAGRERIALIGEAAGAISPSSAEGISYALKTSLYLAESLEEGIEGFLHRYQRKTKDIKTNLLWKNLKCPAMYQPALRKLAMKSGLQSMK